MPRHVTVRHSLSAATLRKVKAVTTDNQRQQLIDLRLQYSAGAKLLSGTINRLIGVERIYPRHLPTQTSFRWSTVEPAITNWPRGCISADCPLEEHEWAEQCWSVRDILHCDTDEVLISWDHDNAEGRIHDLIVNDQAALQAHAEGFDLHTLTCCDMFGMDYPQDKRNPHASVVDAAWRAKYNWQGKDTRQRVLAKNFTHGSKYTDSWRFVYTIPDVERYGATRKQLEVLAKTYIESKKVAWDTKLAIMKGIQRAQVARDLYGGRRIFFDSSRETAKEGFSHMVSGTVSEYNNETLILLERRYGPAVRLLHNAHDGDKIALKGDSVNMNTQSELRQIIEREIRYQGRSITLTATIKM